jgi:hypothetical protein
MDAFWRDDDIQSRRRLTCVPYPSRWTAFADAFDLTWNAIPFVRGGGAALPNEAGLYCFFVGQARPQLPLVLYPLYAGETVNLRQRYSQYVREKDNPKGRYHVRRFLKAFHGEVAFAFALFDGDDRARQSIEKQLNNALMPPYSHKDFTAEVGARKRAMQ